MEVSVEVSGRSDVGKKRTNNQDSILISEKLRAFAVADGMGGHSGGEVASGIAVKTLEKCLQDVPLNEEASHLEKSIKFCNRAIQEFAVVQPQLKGMGTTLTVALVRGLKVIIGHVGDSRCYLFRDHQLYQLTEDHSQVYEMLKAGLIREEDLGLIQKNVITRSVGYDADVQVDVLIRQAMAGDRYLICSDGLTGMVSNDEIAQILGNFDIELAANNLIELANLNGGEDNVSVILFELSGS